MLHNKVQNFWNLYVIDFLYRYTYTSLLSCQIRHIRW